MSGPSDFRQPRAVVITRESQSPPSPHAFSGEEFESGSHDEALGGKKSSQGALGTYATLEAVANRVLGITQAPEASASGRAGLSGCGTMVVASASVTVPVGVPLSKRNMMSLYDLESLKVDYAILDYVGLRLPIPTEVVRYPPEGCVMVFSAMYKHGKRLPLHPWVQMMLSRLGYAPGQYNPNFWSILHGVYIAWWLAKATTVVTEDVEKSVVLCLRQLGVLAWEDCQQTCACPISIYRAVSREEEEEIELESRLVPVEACEIRNIVTPVLFLELGLLQGMVEVSKTIVTVKGSPKVAVDQEERQRKLWERREKDRANRARKMHPKGATSTVEGTGSWAIGKRSR
ncbi:unnamed protein product [Prunus armeniaca]